MDKVILFYLFSLRIIEAIGYRDDLESFGYVIYNLFCDGKPFEKFSQEMTDTNRKLLVKMKTSMVKNIPANNIPSTLNFGKFVKRIS